MFPNLPVLIKGHDHHRGSVALHRGGLQQEVGLSFLQTDAVHDALPLTALQTGLDHREVGGVDAQRNLEGETGLCWYGPVWKERTYFHQSCRNKSVVGRLCLLILSCSD